MSSLQGDIMINADLSQSNKLLKGASQIMTGLSGLNSRIKASDVRIRNGIITEIGSLQPKEGEEVIDVDGCVIYPAWINTHHHLFQSLLKGVPTGINDTLTSWLEHVPYRFRISFNEKRFRTAVRIGLVELALSGCGTVADHNYLYWPDMPFDASSIIFEEASKIGLRMVLCRGGQTKTRNLEKNLPKMLQPESLKSYLDDIEELKKKFHDTNKNPMRTVVVAPTTPLFSMSKSELKEVAYFARSNNLRLHSHLSETVLYNESSFRDYALDPIRFAEEIDWLGHDVWFAHLVKLDDNEITLLGETKTGIAHCPQSNGRLGSGIAPVHKLEKAGVTVSIGVDGAASNEAADMFNELHCAWLMARALGGLNSRPNYDGVMSGEYGAQEATVEDVIRWGTSGGAKILGYDNIGTIEVNKAADIAVYSCNHPRHFGLHDRFIAPIISGGASVKLLIVNGKTVVLNDAIPGLDVELLAQDSARAVREMKVISNL